MTVPIQDSMTHQVSSHSQGYQRWQVASKRYKKDVVIKAIAIAALVIVATALATVALMYLPLPPAINLPIKILMGVAAGAFTLSGVIGLRLRLHPFEFKSYDKEKKAKEVCERIREVYVQIPTQRKSMCQYTLRRMKEWQRYGFLTKESRRALVVILQADEMFGRAIDRLQKNGDLSGDIWWYNAKRESLSRMWRSNMLDVVIPGLPFSS